MNTVILNYEQILRDCLSAWNRAEAEEVAGFYTDDVDYKDPNLAEGVKDKKQFTTYLKILFRKWPIQEWIPNTFFPHAEPGNYTIDYSFLFKNNQKSIQGRGIDRIRFQGDKIALNHVYLNASAWPEWLKKL